MKNEGFQQHQVRTELKKRLFPLQSDSMWTANKNLLTFAFVRDPFDRIESCYQNKMVQGNWMLWTKGEKDLRWMRDIIIER